MIYYVTNKLARLQYPLLAAPVSVACSSSVSVACSTSICCSQCSSTSCPPSQLQYLLLLTAPVVAVAPVAPMAVVCSTGVCHLRLCCSQYGLSLLGLQWLLLGPDTLMVVACGSGVDHLWLQCLSLEAPVSVACSSSQCLLLEAPESVACSTSVCCVQLQCLFVTCSSSGSCWHFNTSVDMDDYENEALKNLYLYQSLQEFCTVNTQFNANWLGLSLRVFS